MLSDEQSEETLTKWQRLRHGWRETRSLVGVVLRATRLYFKLAPWLTGITLVIDVVKALLPFVSAYCVGLGITRLTEAATGPKTWHSPQTWQEYTHAATLVWPYIWPFVVSAAVAMCVQVLSLPQQLIEQALQDSVGDEVEQRLSLQLVRLDLPLLESARFQNLQERVWNVDYAFSSAMRLVSSFVSAFVGLISATIILFHLNPWLMLILTLVAIPPVVVGLKMNNKFEELHNNHGIERTLNRRFNFLVQRYETATEVRLNGAHFHLVDLAKKFGQRWRHRQNKVRFDAGWRTTVLAIGEELVGLGIEMWLILRVITTPGFSIGDYTFYSQVISRFGSSVSTLFSEFTRAHDTALDLRAYYTILDMEPTITSPPDAVRIPSGHIPSVEFVDVTFSYPDAKKPVFDKLNLRIKAGERIALVGHNGAGKTTLIRLLARLYDPDDGAVLVDGIDLRRYDLDDWHSTLGILLQDFNSYQLSLRDNVEIGRVENAGDAERINGALKNADAEGIVATLRRGLDQLLSRIYDDGEQLSGGQWQRVALARTLYRSAGVIVLDEPTAAVDAKAEIEIFTRLLEACGDRTSIVISHRFSTVRQMDRIVFIKNGRVEEDGSHEHLMTIQGGIYRELFELQAAGYR